MTYPLRKNLIATAVALALPGALYAAGEQQAQQGQQKQNQAAKQGGQSQKNLSQIRATDLKDMKVVDAQGKDMGKISELVVDLQSGRIHAAVVEFGGFMGVGDKQYAFPVTQLKPGQQRDQVILNVDKQKLQSAEGFAKNEWPAMGDEYWGRVGGGKASAGASQQKSEGKTQSQQGAQQPGQKMNLTRTSELIGKDVQDKNGQDVGDIKDVVLDLTKGQITNVVLDVKGGGQAMVQPKSLSSGTGDKLVTTSTRDELRNRARKSEGQAQGNAAGASAGASAGQSERSRGNSDVPVLGPERPGQGPLGSTATGTPKPDQQKGTPSSK